MKRNLNKHTITDGLIEDIKMISPMEGGPTKDTRITHPPVDNAEDVLQRAFGQNGTMDPEVARLEALAELQRSMPVMGTFYDAVETADRIAWYPKPSPSDPDNCP